MKIGIDLGGSHIGIGLVDGEKILEKTERDIVGRENTEEDILNYIHDGIEKLKSNHTIELVGIATPGNVKDNCMENLVNFGIQKLNFNSIIRKYSDIKFQIRNDSKSAALAEQKYGALSKYNDSVFLCLGTGIGSAVFLNKKMLIANRNVGFELGHMIINKDGIWCNCGKKGCFETYCSIKRFKDNVKEVLGIEDISSENLIEVIQRSRGNEELENLINNYIENLIVGLSNIIDIFEPEAICLGGSFVYFKDIFYDETVRRMNARKYVFNKDFIPKIVLAELKNDAGIIGATI